MLSEWVLILTLTRGGPFDGAAITSVPMATLEACTAAGEDWKDQMDFKWAKYICLKTGQGETT